jgi:steroid 5-alpha reductase family enzyme
MKKLPVTIITAVITAALAAAAVILSEKTLSMVQFDTMKILLIICGCSAAYCFTAGEISGNFSQMDKLWSILPPVYVWVVAAKGGFSARLVIYALIVTAWGIRLTVNFARKGAYSLRFWSGKEDYRWSVVRQFPVFRHRIAWSLFDLLFISIYQNALVLAICLPSLAIMGSDVPLGFPDILAAVLSIGFLILETVADEYQWKFHQTKKKLLAGGGSLEDLPDPYDLGFNTTGPWRRMRHPNYLGEQGFWLAMYIFTVGAGVTRCGIFHWSLAGPLLLVLLFMGSSALGEKISSGKYPAYAEYIRQVFKYVPLRRFERGR